MAQSTVQRRTEDARRSSNNVKRAIAARRAGVDARSAMAACLAAAGFPEHLAY